MSTTVDPTPAACLADGTPGALSGLMVNLLEFRRPDGLSALPGVRAADSATPACPKVLMSACGSGRSTCRTARGEKRRCIATHRVRIR